MRTLRKSLLTISAMAVATVALLIFTACGSDDGGAPDSRPVGFQQVNDTGTSFTPDDLNKIGFKK